MRNRLHQPVGLDELEEHVLHEVFGIDFVRNAPADEGQQSASFVLEHRRQAPVLLRPILSDCQHLVLSFQ